MPLSLNRSLMYSTRPGLRSTSALYASIASSVRPSFASKRAADRQSTAINVGMHTSYLADGDAVDDLARLGVRFELRERLSQLAGLFQRSDVVQQRLGQVKVVVRHVLRDFSAQSVICKGRTHLQYRLVRRQDFVRLLEIPAEVARDGERDPALAHVGPEAEDGPSGFL